jgi:Mn2+/Fe2+ NRAMP family transporter
VFLIYLLVWTVFTAGAMVTACGVAGTGLFPLTSDLRTSKIAWGIIHSIVGAVLVWRGGFKLFERLMSACIAVMFFAVILTAILVGPDWGGVATGLLVPQIPPSGTGYTLGVLGGVGGTLTLLSYGYWIREKGRKGQAGARACRIDLGVGYTMTALFGIAIIIIGSRVDLTRGPTLALELAGQQGTSMRALARAPQLGNSLGSFGKWLFLIGFWGAVFSSLLGVWQSVPYLFADFVYLSRRGDIATVDLSTTLPYRVYLTLIAVGSLPLLWLSVERAQLSYAVLGSFFMPLLALTLLLMNNRTSWVGKAFRNGWVTNMALGVTLLFFAAVAIRTVAESVGRILS